MRRLLGDLQVRVMGWRVCQKERYEERCGITGCASSVWIPVDRVAILNKAATAGACVEPS